MLQSESTFSATQASICMYLNQMPNTSTPKSWEQSASYFMVYHNLS